MLLLAYFLPKVLLSYLTKKPFQGDEKNKLLVFQLCLKVLITDNRNDIFFNLSFHGAKRVSYFAVYTLIFVQESANFFVQYVE